MCVFIMSELTLQRYMNFINYKWAVENSQHINHKYDHTPTLETSKLNKTSLKNNDTAHLNITVHNLGNKDFPGCSTGHLESASLNPWILN